MADKHPYVSGGGTLVQVITQFRNSFPATVNATTLQKLGLAPKNESYVLNILRFLKLIDDEGKRTSLASKVFSQHDDTQFTTQFSEVIKEGYNDLFELHGENAWKLERNSLITFFRSTDHTTGLVGGRQAGTFQVLAALAGHGEAPKPKSSQQPKKTKTSKGKPAKKITPAKAEPTKQGVDIPNMDPKTERDIGLTVRVEINLPSDADQETYDKIFKSIRENLLNG